MWAGMGIFTALGPHSLFFLYFTHCPWHGLSDVLWWPSNQLLKVLKATGVKSMGRRGRNISVRKDTMRWVSSLVVDTTLPILLTAARVPLITIISLIPISTKCPKCHSA